MCHYAHQPGKQLPLQSMVILMMSLHWTVGYNCFHTFWTMISRNMTYPRNALHIILEMITLQGQKIKPLQKLNQPPKLTLLQSE